MSGIDWNTCRSCGKKRDIYFYFGQCLECQRVHKPWPEEEQSSEPTITELQERIDELELIVADRDMAARRVQPKATLASLYTPQAVKVQKKEEPGGFTP